ncbi:MAG: glycosyltransferase family 39 protein [Planctomycetaceae bacterium]|nr:glycosyltransferase family 39 protein [Planctomycetaceae bacterium]
MPQSRIIAFIVIYSLLWGLVPYLVQQNVRPDTVEQYFIGEALPISTSKHPTLGANILEAVFRLTGTPSATYMCTSLALLVMLTSVWKLSEEFLMSPLVFLALLASCNYRYMNIGAAYFHNSVSILPFWCMTVLFFYYACKTGKLRWWFFTGITLGLGLNCKYPAGFLAITLFFFTLLFRRDIDSEDGTKRCPAMAGLLLVILVSSALFFPHLQWNLHHGFPTLTYASSVGDREVFGALKFLVSSIGMLLPILISLLPILLIRNSASHSRHTALSSETPNWRRYFLPFIVAVPLLLQVGIAVFSGKSMLSRHGTHLWLFLPLLLVWCFSAAVGKENIRKAFIYTVVVAVLTLGTFAGNYIFEPLAGKKACDTLFPGRQLAAEVEKIWHSKYDVPIPFAAGEWKLAGNVALYGKDRPKVLAFGGNDYFGINEKLNITPWYKPDDLQKGAVILWTYSGENLSVPSNLTTDFPNAVPLERDIILEYQTFWQQYRKTKFPPLQIGIAIIPPKK